MRISAKKDKTYTPPVNADGTFKCDQYKKCGYNKDGLCEYSLRSDKRSNSRECFDNIFKAVASATKGDMIIHQGYDRIEYDIIKEIDDDMTGCYINFMGGGSIALKNVIKIVSKADCHNVVFAQELDTDNTCIFFLYSGVYKQGQCIRYRSYPYEDYKYYVITNIMTLETANNFTIAKHYVTTATQVITIYNNAELSRQVDILFGHIDDIYKELKKYVLQSDYSKNTEAMRKALDKDLGNITHRLTYDAYGNRDRY